MKTNKFLSGFALGAVIGSALGIFYHPKSGKESRDKFKKLSKTFSENLIKDVTKAKKIGKKEYEAILENIVQKHSKNDLLTTEAWQEIGSELKERWNDIQREMKNTTSKKVAKKKK